MPTLRNLNRQRVVNMSEFAKQGLISNTKGKGININPGFLKYGTVGRKPKRIRRVVFCHSKDDEAIDQARLTRNNIKDFSSV
jgi:hypothetical protein